MKKINYIIVIIVGLMFTACSEDFLEKRPTSFLSNDDLGETALINPSIVEGNLRGIYNQMVTAGIGGTGSQEDFGHKSFDLMSDTRPNYKPSKLYWLEVLLQNHK
jgi:hypothetical protein